MKIAATILILMGFIGSVFGAGIDPTGIIETAQGASMLSDRGLFLASQIIMLIGFCIAGRELLKRLDAASAQAEKSRMTHTDFIEKRLAEMTGALDQSNAVVLRNNELIAQISTKL